MIVARALDDDLTFLTLAVKERSFGIKTGAYHVNMIKAMALSNPEREHDCHNSKGANVLWAEDGELLASMPLQSIWRHQEAEH